MTKIFLKRGKEESLGRRHPWVFSGAIERMEGEPAEGDVVDVYSRQGEFLASGWSGCVPLSGGVGPSGLSGIR